MMASTARTVPTTRTTDQAPTRSQLIAKFPEVAQKARREITGGRARQISMVNTGRGDFDSQERLGVKIAVHGTSGTLDDNLVAQMTAVEAVLERRNPNFTFEVQVFTENANTSHFI